MGSGQPGHSRELHGRRLLLRPPPEGRTRRADRPAWLKLGWHAHRAVDTSRWIQVRPRPERHRRQPQGLPEERRQREHSPPVRARALQRHDLPAETVRHPGRNLVSGRIQQRRGHALLREEKSPHQRLAQRLEKQEAAVLFRAARAVQVRQPQSARSRRHLAGTTQCSRHPAHRHGGDYGHQQHPRHSSEEQAGSRTPPRTLGAREELRQKGSCLLRPVVQVV